MFEWTNGLSEVVVSVLAVVVSGFIIPWLRNMAAEKQAVAKNEEQDWWAGFHDTIRQVAEEHALNIAEREFPKLAKKILERHDTVEPMKGYEIRAELDKWGARLKGAIVGEARNLGVDLSPTYSEFQNVVLDRIVRGAADAVSPVPGRPTAETLSSDIHLVKALATKGVTWVRTHEMSKILQSFSDDAGERLATTHPGDAGDPSRHKFSSKTLEEFLRLARPRGPQLFGHLTEDDPTHETGQADDD